MPSWVGKASYWVLVAFQMLAGLIGLSVLFAPEDDRFEHDALVLISTFGLGMAAFGLAITLFGLRRGEQWAWMTLWAWPVFLVVHVITLGTVVPDLFFAVIVAAALLALRPAGKPATDAPVVGPDLTQRSPQDLG